MSHHLRWSAAGLVVVGLGFVTAQHLHLFSGTDSTALPASEAEQRYDDSASSTSSGPGTSPTTTVGRLPASGVYMYATTGRDSVDALNGAHHDYPATTTITVMPTPCGVQQRWDILEQRWQEWQRCTDGLGISETGRTNYDEFFGQSQTDSWLCTGAPRDPPHVAHPVELTLRWARGGARSRRWIANAALLIAAQAHQNEANPSIVSRASNTTAIRLITPKPGDVTDVRQDQRTARRHQQPSAALGIQDEDRDGNQHRQDHECKHEVNPRCDVTDRAGTCPCGPQKMNATSSWCRARTSGSAASKAYRRRPSMWRNRTTSTPPGLPRPAYRTQLAKHVDHVQRPVERHANSEVHVVATTCHIVCSAHPSRITSVLAIRRKPRTGATHGERRLISSGSPTVSFGMIVAHRGRPQVSLWNFVP